MHTFPSSILSQLSKLTPFRLANEADVSCPDTSTSEGSLFLASVRDGVVDMLANNEDMSDDDISEAIAELADSAPSIYTHQKWHQFVDLAGYNEDISEFVSDSTDIDTMPSLALYRIADRLAFRLVDLAGELLTEAIETAIDGARELGATHGENAAAWWEQDAIGGRASGDPTVVASLILAGIQDGDPEMMDALPYADLSGEMADGMSIARILEDIGSDLTLETLMDHEALTDLADAYREAHDGAMVAAIETACIELLDTIAG